MEMREFNTCGPNIPERHYTIYREDLIQKGLAFVRKERYFTIWAPRQTGKSTYFRQLAERLSEQGYRVAMLNVEACEIATLSDFVAIIKTGLEKSWRLPLGEANSIPQIFNLIQHNNEHRCVLIIDEIEGVNAAYMHAFLHAIRSAYQTRDTHCLKSVIIVGVSPTVEVISSNVSPFNIMEYLKIPYFSNEESKALLQQHEEETGQRFEESVIRQISQITANQPGLLNLFAKTLVEKYPDKKTIGIDDYYAVEAWILTESIDNHFENILRIARKERPFLEKLLFTESKIRFEIDRPSIKELHIQGMIQKDENNNVRFRIPFYQKRLFKAFYPYTNGEQQRIQQIIDPADYFTKDNAFIFDGLIQTYKQYVKRRGFSVFREKNEDGQYKSIKEAALIYSFETYINAIIAELGGKIYREAHTGLGKSDMIINLNAHEYIVETKVYYSPRYFAEGKKQLAYYCKSLPQDRGIYIVYCPNNIPYPKHVVEGDEVVEGVTISTYLIEYDEEKW